MVIDEILKILKDISLYGLEKLGIYVSQYRGFVADIDDPKKWGRIKVSVPEVYGDHVYEGWAWPRSHYSGKGYGLRLLPRVDDLIWVTFERGNPRKPLWSFGHIIKGDVPEELDSFPIWFRTPKGITIAIDEGNKLINIYHKDNKTKLEPAALGTKTKDKISTLIDKLLAAKVNTSLGPQPFMPDTIQALNELKSTLNEIEATNIKIT